MSTFNRSIMRTVFDHKRNDQEKANQRFQSLTISGVTSTLLVDLLFSLTTYRA